VEGVPVTRIRVVDNSHVESPERSKHGGGPGADAQPLRTVGQRGASGLMVPAEILVVDKVPVRGSGKLDFSGVRKLVLEMTAESVAAVA